MENSSQNYDLYISNLESVLEDVLSPNFNLQNIKENYLSHVFGNLKQFEESNYSESIRQEFVTHILSLMNQTELLLLDTKFLALEERKEILNQIKHTIKKIFPDVTMNDPKPLTTDEKIILLDYLGVLDFLSNSGINQKQMAYLFEQLLERSHYNIVTSIRHINGKMFIEGSVKNEKSLNTVKEFATKLKLTDLIRKANDDLAQQDKAKQKKR